MQPWDYVHKPGVDGLTVENFIARQDSTTGTPLLGQLYAQPWFTGDLPLRIRRLGIRVTGAGATNQRIGIYTSTSSRNLYPDALVADLGIISYAAPGIIYCPNNDVTLLAGGLYWVATLANASAGTHNPLASTLQEMTVPSGPLGSYATVPTNAQNLAAMVWNVARSYASGLPATFPAGATGLESNRVPAIAWEPF